MCLFKNSPLVTCELMGKAPVCVHAQPHVHSKYSVQLYKEENDFPKGHRPFIPMGHILSMFFTLSHRVVVVPLLFPLLFYAYFQAVC